MVINSLTKNKAGKGDKVILGWGCSLKENDQERPYLEDDI